jgi:hypothetical protein
MLIMIGLSLECTLEDCVYEKAELQPQPRPENLFLYDSIRFDKTKQYLYINFQMANSTCIRLSSWQRGLDVWLWNPVTETWEAIEGDSGLFFHLIWAIRRTIQRRKIFAKKYRLKCLRLFAPSGGVNLSF